MAMEWTISIEGKNDFGDVCRQEIRIDKSDERLRDGDLGLSINDGGSHRSRNLPGLGNARADGIDGAAGKLDPVSTGGQHARGILGSSSLCVKRW